MFNSFTFEACFAWGDMAFASVLDLGVRFVDAGTESPILYLGAQTGSI